MVDIPFDFAQGDSHHTAIAGADSSLRGNDGLPHDELMSARPVMLSEAEAYMRNNAATPTTNPSRGDVKLSNHPSDPGVKTPVNTAVTPVTPNLKSEKLNTRPEHNQPNTIRSLSTNPSRGDIRLSNHPSDPGVSKSEGTLEEKLAALKAEMGLTADGKKLTYSQQLKQRLNKASLERRKSKG